MVSDEALVRRHLAGDGEAFAELIARHQDRIYRLALLWLKAPDEAADVAQEVFLRAWSGFNRFRFAASPGTWLVRVARNVCREYNRRAKPEMLREPQLTADGPHCYWADRQMWSQLRGLVTRLPPRQQEVVVLRVFEEFSIKQTAQAMHCRPGTVKALLNKAVARLRQELEGAAESELSSLIGDEF